MSRLVVGPFNRVEGDLEVRLDVENNRVAAAYVSASLYRGFEQILQKKDPMDALVIAPRVCGICSVAQSVAAANAIGDAMKLERPPNGRLAQNIILATENLADHLTHFCFYFMPDFARQTYQNRKWFDRTEKRFKAGRGESAAAMLSVRAEFMHILGIMAGKWPHSLSLQPGGTTRSITSSERIRLLAHIRQFRSFLEQNYFGADLAAFNEMDSVAKLETWADGVSPDTSDLRLFFEIANDLQLDQLGRAGDRFMSFGNYPQPDGSKFFPSGLWHKGPEELDWNAITEDATYSWLYGNRQMPPFEGVTQPLAEKDDAYSWCKAPRIDGAVVETGALARQLIGGRKLIAELVSQSGGNVRNRILARMLEVALVIPVMEQWVKDIEPSEPFCSHAEMPDEAEGMGVVEAARGSLGHWLKIKDGRIENYQIIAPTTWNFSPRDQNQIPGALEQALEGTPVDAGDANPVAVQHVVRSFDPCMVCTVH